MFTDLRQFNCDVSCSHTPGVFTSSCSRRQPFRFNVYECLLRIQMSVYHLTYHLTIYKRVLLGKLTVSFLVNKYPVFNAIRIFNKVFTMAVYWYCTSLKPDEFILYRSVLALFSLFQHYFLICTSVHISSLLHS